MDQNFVITIIVAMLFLCCVAPMIVRSLRRGKMDAPKNKIDPDPKRKE